MKKSRDSREIFAVFRKGSFMEEATFGEKFRYWFKNVYLYHFGFFTLIAIVVAILAFSLIGDVINREYNDLDYILGGSVFASDEQLDALSDHLSGFIEKESGEEVTTGQQLLCTESILGTGDAALALDEYNAGSIEKITVSMADDEVLLFFFDKKYIEWYAAMGAFEPLSEFGIESDNGYYVRVDSLPVIEELGIICKNGLYAGIKVKTKSRMENERIAKKYENSGKALYGLLYGR